MRPTLSLGGNALRSMVATSVTMFAILSSADAKAQTTPKQPAPHPQQAQPLSATKRALIEKQREWHKALINAPVPHSGCFKAEYPRLAWQEVQCVTPPNIPMPPRKGPLPATVGNGYDYSALVSGHLFSVIGSFDTVATTGEKGLNYNSQTTQVADSYTLQLNSNTFNSPPVCSGAMNPATCQGWQQYVYSSRSTGSVFIQYWLINYANRCPAGWNSYGGDCYRNSSGSVTVPVIPATSLAQVSLTGSVSAGGDDRLDLANGGSHYALTSPDSMVSLADNWTTAEFAIVGDCCLYSANFNANSSLAVRATVHNGTTNAPTCVVAGFTGETNNLNLSSTPAIGVQAAPTLISDQLSVPVTPASCAVASGLGDIHIRTFTPTPQVNAPVVSLAYDFQATGEFILARMEDGFEVQTRQVSGGATWPNTSLNQAIAAKIGKSVVMVSVGNNAVQLLIDGAPVALGNGERRVLPDNGDVMYRDNTYVVRDLGGNSVRMVVHKAVKYYIDVYVGLGRWPTSVEGLLASARNNTSAVAARGGTVFPAPFNFGTFYSQYGDSWRVSGSESLFEKVRTRLSEVSFANPARPFVANDLPKTAYAAAKRQCDGAGVKSQALDDCIVDVAVVGDGKAALSHVRPQVSAATRVNIFKIEEAVSTRVGH